MNKKPLIALLASLLPSLVFAHNIQVGQTVPNIDVKDYGELVIENSNVVYQPWNTANMMGKVRVIQAIAGRSSSKKMNAPLMTAITASKFPESDYQTTTIINQDDAIWGTGGFVKSSAEDSKQEFPWSSMVLDENGVAAKAWQLQEENSAIIVQDKTGTVLFAKEGSLNETEIETVLGLIKAAL